MLPYITLFGRDSRPSLSGPPVTKLSIPQLTKEDVIVALVGLSGVGKSTLINRATRTEVARVGEQLEGCTQEIEAFECWHPHTHRRVIIVDTPGFDDSRISDAEVLKRIALWLKSTFKKRILLTGILYLHRITDKRMAGSPLRILNMFSKLCGEQGLKNVLFTTTMWDLVTDFAVSNQREKELQEDFWKPMLERGAATARFYNTDASAWSLIDVLLDRSDPCPLQLQEEMVGLYKPLSDTEAGRVLMEFLQQLIKRQIEIRDSLAAMMRSHGEDQEFDELSHEYDKMREELRRALDGVRSLKITLGERALRFFAFWYTTKHTSMS